MGGCGLFRMRTAAVTRESNGDYTGALQAVERVSASPEHTEAVWTAHKGEWHDLVQGLEACSCVEPVGGPETRQVRRRGHGVADRQGRDGNGGRMRV